MDTFSPSEAIVQSRDESCSTALTDEPIRHDRQQAGRRASVYAMMSKRKGQNGLTQRIHDGKSSCLRERCFALEQGDQGTEQFSAGHILQIHVHSGR